jgi:SPP1 gp7 family putative phage head morphogenesis protein
MGSNLQQLKVEIIAYFATGTVSQNFAQTVGSVAASIVEDEVAVAEGLVMHDVDDPMQIARDWVRQSADRLYKLTAVTQAMIFEIVQDVDTVEELSGAIDDIYAVMKGSRTDTIARTEVLAASNFAAFAVYDDANIPYKGWVAILDAKTRDSHASAHGQRVPMDMPFDVGGTPMMYPGDPSAPANEVINCRCTLLPETSDRSIWTSKRVDAIWIAYLRRTSAWETQMARVVRVQFDQQLAHIKSLMRHHNG